MPKAQQKSPKIDAQTAPRRSVGSPRKRAEEVMEAAAAVFADKGYHGASTQDIADRLGIRQATLYYYFRSKEMALELVCQKGTEGFIDRAETIVSMKADAHSKLTALIKAHLHAIEENFPFVKTFLNERQYLRDEARSRIGRLSRRYEQSIQKVIETGVASGELRQDLDIRLTTLSLLALCNSAAAWYGKMGGLSITTIEATFFDLIWRGIEAGPSIRKAHSKKSAESKKAETK